VSSGTLGSLFGRIHRHNCLDFCAIIEYPYFVERKPMILKKGMHIAARTMPKGQKGEPFPGMLVMPKTEVTKVRG